MGKRILDSSSPPLATPVSGLARRDTEVEGYLIKRAQAKGVELDELVNQLRKCEIEIIERGE